MDPNAFLNGIVFGMIVVGFLLLLALALQIKRLEAIKTPTLNIHESEEQARRIASAIKGNPVVLAEGQYKAIAQLVSLSVSREVHDQLEPLLGRIAQLLVMTGPHVQVTPARNIRETPSDVSMVPVMSGEQQANFTEDQRAAYWSILNATDRRQAQKVFYEFKRGNKKP